MGGCVASQEGEAITRARALRRPGVRAADPASAAADDRASGARTGRAVVDVSFPEIEKFDHLPAPRAEGARAYVSVMEGCSKYCSFCIVPYTRGEEVSRSFDSVLAEVRAARRAGRRGDHAARAERQRLSRVAMADGAQVDLATLIHHVARDCRHRAHPLHHLASARIQRQPDRGVSRACRSSPIICTCRCRAARTGCSRS